MTSGASARRARKCLPASSSNRFAPPFFLWGLIEETLLLRASALTFATLLFLVPFFAMMFYLIQTFNLGDHIYDKIDERLTHAVESIRNLAVEEEDVPNGTSDTNDSASSGETVSTVQPEATVPEGETPDNVLPKRKKRLPEESDALLKQELIGWVFPIFNAEHSITDDPAYENPVKLLVRFAEEGASSPHAIGVSGLLFILSTVFGFMRNVEYTFNRIWVL